MKNSILFFAAVFFIVSCSGNSKKNEKSISNIDTVKYDYFILTKIIDEDILSSIKKNNIYGIDTLITNNDENKSVKIGFYKDLRSASEHAFALYSDSLISNYDLVYKDSIVQDIYNEFIFVGKYLDDRPALYSADLKKRQYELQWSKWGRKILTIDFSPTDEYAYFLTAYRFGKNSSFPHLIDTKLFNFDIYSKEIKLVKDFGKGVTYYSYWQNEDEYKTIFTFIDTTITSNLTESRIVFDKQGKIISDTVKNYNLEKDGFPKIERKKELLNESDNPYLILTEMNGTDYITKVMRKSDNKVLELHNGPFELNKVEWKENFHLIAELTNKSSVSENDSLYTKIIVAKLDPFFVSKEINLAGLRNTKTFSSLIIYDEGYGENSELVFYDYINNREYWRIKVPGGCGIKNIPVE